MLLVASAVAASLDTSWSGTGRFTLDADAWGDASASAGLVQVTRPVEGEVVRAFVVLAASPGSGDPGPDAVEVLGLPVTLAEADQAGVGEAWARWGDVTDELRATLEALPEGPADLDLVEVGLDPAQTEGLGLVVVWQDPASELATVAVALGVADLFDGVAWSVSVDASGMLGAELGLGIAYSAGEGWGQVSTVEVGGVEVSATAGGYDDGAFANGALFTMGGGDDTPDSERYDLGSTLSPADTEVAVAIQGPEVDDYGVVGWLVAPGVVLAGARWCGDGVVDEGEDCDDGNEDSSDACSNLCRASSSGPDTGVPGDTGAGLDDSGPTDTNEAPPDTGDSNTDTADTNTDADSDTDTDTDTDADSDTDTDADADTDADSDTDTDADADTDTADTADTADTHDTADTADTHDTHEPDEPAPTDTAKGEPASGGGTCGCSSSPGRAPSALLTFGALVWVRSRRSGRCPPST